MKIKYFFVPMFNHCAVVNDVKPNESVRHRHVGADGNTADGRPKFSPSTLGLAFYNKDATVNLYPSSFPITRASYRAYMKTGARPDRKA